MCNWQYPSIGLDNGLAPNRWQAIIWANADPIHWRIYAALGGDELINLTQILGRLANLLEYYWISVIHCIRFQ